MFWTSLCAFWTGTFNNLTNRCVETQRNSLSTSPPPSLSIYVTPAKSIDSLPPELFDMIITSWADVDPDAVWMASSVCKAWRRAALTNNKAWSRVYVEFKPQPEEMDESWCIEEDDLEIAASPRGKPRPMALWLERTGRAELILHMTIDIAYPAVALSLGEMVSLFTPEMERVRSLSLSCNSDIVAMSFLMLLCKSMPRLRHFHLGCYEKMHLNMRRMRFTGDGELRELWDLLQRAPLLESLTWAGTPLAPASCTLPPLPVTCLSFVNVHRTPTSVLYRIKEFANLTSLHISEEVKTCVDYDGPPVRRSGPPTITLSNLVELHMNGFSIDNVLDFIASVSVPLLRVLSVGFGGWAYEYKAIVAGANSCDAMADFRDTLVAFAKRTAGVETLSLASLVLPDRYLVDFMASFPRLTKLRLEKMSVGAPAFRRLAKCMAGNSRVVVCPRLAHLTLVDCEFLAGEHVVDLVRARAESTDTTSITHLEIRQCKKVRAAHIATLKGTVQARLLLEYQPFED